MFFRRGKDEYRMGGRLFERLKEGVESSRRKHVYLIDYIYAVAPYLGRDTHLLCQAADIVNGVIRSSVKFVYAETAPFAEAAAGFALPARFAVRRVEAVYGFGENTRAGGFTYAARPTEEVSVRQLAARYSILQCRSDMRLPDHRLECYRAVFPG